MIYEIKSTGSIGQKLAIVKAIKEMTGMGLMDSKDIVDYLQHQVGNVREIDININENFPEYLKIFRDNNILIGDSREDKLDDLDMITSRIIYKVFEGSYVIENGIITMNIINGVVLDPNNLIYGTRRDLYNTTIEIDHRDVIVETPHK